jgi:hypothetical protein
MVGNSSRLHRCRERWPAEIECESLYFRLAEYLCVATGFLSPRDMSHQFNLVSFSDTCLDLLLVDETDIALEALVVA